MFADRASPLSSPSSSPTLCIDSSPASSPPLEPMDLDDELPPPMTLIHPLAASVKANRMPPQREMKTSVRLKTTTPCPQIHPEMGPPKKKFRSDHYDSIDVNWTDEDEDPELVIWDAAITKVVDNGHGAISLSEQNLTYIPKKISELRNFVAIPEPYEQANAPRLTSLPAVLGGRLFTRVTTAPASTSGGSLFTRSSISDRTKSIADASIGLAREQLQLFLAGNQIRTLPRELFDLQKMTVLILRGNQLSHLPPEIVRLTNLRELNISNNNLQYLPSEMSRMTLSQLRLHPNPWLRPPPPPFSSLNFRPLQNSPSAMRLPSRCMSESTHPLPHAIPLVELALRTLVSHYVFPEADPTPSETILPPEAHDTVLATYYPLPLDEWDIPQPLRDVLGTCVPGAAPEEDNTTTSSRATSEPRVTGVSVCPSPRHTRRTLFVHHAEELFVWENYVAGVHVGGAVPLRWRGCQWGCLDFMNPEIKSGIDTPALGFRDMEASEANDGPEVGQLLNLSLSSEFDEFD